MNICVNSTFDCSIEDFQAMFDKFEEDFRKCASDWKISIVNDHEVIVLANVTDMDGLQAIMGSDEMTQWDEENNCVDRVYSLENIN